MTLKNTAVQGMTVIVDVSSVAPPGTVASTIAVASPTITTCRAEAKLLHVDGNQVTVSAITVPSAGATIADAGPYTVPLNSTAVKSKAEGIEVLRVDDISDTIDATPKIPGNPPTDYPVSFID